MPSNNATVLIADDDPEQLAYLAALVRRMRPTWQIVSEVTTAAAVTRDILALEPSLAILDVRFSDTTTIELVRGLRENYPVIFVTGDPLFAADAFTCDAIDFVLKPIKLERFEQALRKAEATIFGRSGSNGQQQRYQASSLRMSRGLDLIWSSLTEVRYFQAQRKYTRVVLKNQDGLLKFGISSIVQYLDPNTFWRIHRGLIVNIRHMTSAKRDEMGRLLLKLDDRDEKLLVSRPYESLFKDGFS